MKGLNYCRRKGLRNISDSKSYDILLWVSCLISIYLFPDGAEKIAASAELLPRRQALVTIENNEIMIAGVSLKKKKSAKRILCCCSVTKSCPTLATP